MIRTLRTYLRALGTLALLALAAACSGDAAGTISGPDTGTGPGGGDPGAAGTYRLSTVNGQNMPFLVDAAVLGPSYIESYVTGGKMVLQSNGSYTAEVYGRFVMDGKVTNRTSSGSGTWQLVGDGKLKLSTSKGGSVEMQRTWYTLTETRKFPVDSTKEVDLIYVWVKD